MTDTRQAKMIVITTLFAINIQEDEISARPRSAPRLCPTHPGGRPYLKQRGQALFGVGFPATFDTPDRAEKTCQSLCQVALVDVA